MNISEYIIVKSVNRPNPSSSIIRDFSIEASIFYRVMQSKGALTEELDKFELGAKRFIRQEINNYGFCIGACLLLAKRVMPFLEKKETEFKNILITCANEFKKGVPASGIINQLANSALFCQIDIFEEIWHSPRFTQLIEKIPELVEEKKLIQEEGAVLKIYLQNFITIEHGNLHNIYKNIDHLIAENEKYDVYAEISDNKIEKFINGFMIPFMKGELDLSSHNLNSTKMSNENGIAAIFDQAFDLVIKDFIAKHSKTKCFIKQMNFLAALRELEMHNLESLQNKRNSHYLSQIQTLDKGIYLLNLSATTFGHSTLLFKHDEQTFFWDPNIGLMICPKKAEVFISGVFDTIYPAQESQTGQHFIDILKIVPR